MEADEVAAGRRLGKYHERLYALILVTGSYYGDLSVWDVSLGLELYPAEDRFRPAEDREGPIHFCRLSNDDRKIVSVHMDAGANSWAMKIWDWDADTLRLQGTVALPGNVVAISPGGDLLITENAEIVSVETGQKLRTLRDVQTPIYVACFTPRRDKVVTVSESEPRKLTTWEVASGGMLREFDRHTHNP